MSIRARAAVLSLSLPLLLGGAFPAAAQGMAPPMMGPPPVQDRISLSLAVEDWVSTSTARVVLVIDAGGGNAGSARGQILKAAESTADHGDWRIEQFTRQPDQSGLDHWQAVLEARLPENQLGSLADRAHQASHPGLQIKVAQIDFTPTLAEQEAVRGHLRQMIYKQAAEEAKAVNAAFPGRDYRVSDIAFDAVDMPSPHPVMLREAMTVAAPLPNRAEDDGGGMNVTKQAHLRARVTLDAYAPAPKP